jgi:hypothetical protein
LPDWATHPVTAERFDDFADVINPNRRETHCWCLSHRLRAKEIDELGDGSRESAARVLAAGETSFGVVSYRRASPSAHRGRRGVGRTAGRTRGRDLPRRPEGRMGVTMTFVGTRSMFERCGFEVIGQTNGVASKLPRLSCAGCWDDRALADLTLAGRRHHEGRGDQEYGDHQQRREGADLVPDEPEQRGPG